MSRNINVNPGQYKVKGRERQGEDVIHEREKAEAARVESMPARAKRFGGRAGTTRKGGGAGAKRRAARR